MSSSLKSVNATLRKFADGLKADDDYREQGFEYCEKVRLFLLQNNYSVASTHYVGSIGKKTDVQNPDFDIVMKINDQKPPFEKILLSWKNALLSCADQLNIKRDTMKTTRFSVQFTFTNNVKVDLLPSAADVTYQQALDVIAKDRQSGRFYSSSLVERQVEFVKEQDAFTHAVARLAKYWYKSMDFGENCYIAGGSTIFELLAVASVLEEKKKQNFGIPGNKYSESMYDAFMGVIDKVEKLDQLRLAFEKMSGFGGNWRTAKAGGQTIPYLVEPANKYNNLLKEMHPFVIQVFKWNGREIKSRFTKLVAPNGAIDFNKLFETMPAANVPRRSLLTGSAFY